MKKDWQTLSLLFLMTFLLVIRIPLISSQAEISWSSNIEKTLEIVRVQTDTHNDGKIAPEIIAQKVSPQSNQQDFPFVIEKKPLFKLSSIEGLSAEEGTQRAANLPVDNIAEQYLQNIKETIAQYREKYNLEKIGRRIVSAVIEVTIVIVLLILLRKILHRLYRQTEAWRENIFRPLKIQSLQLFSVDQEANLFLGLVKLIYWFIVSVIVFIYLSLLTRYFPQTKKLGLAIFDSLANVLRRTGEAFLNYLPNLFSILVTVVVAYYFIRFCRLFFNAIDGGTISLPGFDRDWARPTGRLVVFLIFALTLTVIFPLLPGAQSPAFRGVSIFVGALFTLGGASAIANLVGGFVIIYTRAFRIGDRVQIADVRGDIFEKTILSTRIRTPKNEIVTIPNANIITSNIKNFTTAFRDINEPLILHTTITLGYDVPWRQVHQVLIEAARSSPQILETPAPFVLQTNLGDFSVSYELNAYTNQPSMMPQIYSQLHQNIQDKCNEAGIEILSPQYSAVRDGNQNTIPEDYLSPNYTAPGFRIDPLARLLNQPFSPANQSKPINNQEK